MQYQGQPLMQSPLVQAQQMAMQRGSLEALRQSGLIQVVGSPIQRAAGGGTFTYQELASTGLVNKGAGTFALEQKLRPFQPQLQPLALIGERF